MTPYSSRRPRPLLRALLSCLTVTGLSAGALALGGGDALAAGTTRPLPAHLSAPYFESGLQMAVPQRTDDIWYYADLGGKRVAVVADSPAARFAESIQPRYDFSVVPARGVEEL